MPNKEVEEKVGGVRGLYRLDRENSVQSRKRERGADFMVGKCIVSEHLDCSV